MRAAGGGPWVALRAQKLRRPHPGLAALARIHRPSIGTPAAHGEAMQKLRTEPSLSTVALTVILWATFGVGLIMIMVVLLRS